MLKKIDRKLVIIVVIGYALRVIGLEHSFPFIFHPDEATIIRTALEIRFNPNPQHFDWPHLYVYLNYFLYMAFAYIRNIIDIAGLKQYSYFLFPIIWNEELIFYLLTRAFTATLGALTAVPMYLIGKELYNKKTGLLFALGIAITPYHVWHSHYSLPDVPMLFFLTWSLYFSTKILFKGDLINYLLAGLFAGLAASTKYNAAIIILAIVLAHVMRITTDKRDTLFSYDSFETMFLSALSAVFGFLIGTPYAIFDYQTFLIKDSSKGALWQFTNVGGVNFKTHLIQFFHELFIELPVNVGYTFMILFVAAMVYLLWHLLSRKSLTNIKDKLFFVLLAIVVIYYVSGFERTRSHYFFVSYPMILISGISFMMSFFESAAFNNRLKTSIIFLMFTLPFYFSLINSLTFFREDTRVMLWRWLSAERNAESSIFYYDRDLEIVMAKLENESDKVEETFMPTTIKQVLVSSTPKEGLSHELFINNNLRRGPKLYIYRVR